MVLFWEREGNEMYENDMNQLEALIREISDMKEIRTVEKLLEAQFERIRTDAMRKLRPGQEVAFWDNRREHRQEGIIVKVNQTTVSVNVAGQVWKVSPTLLETRTS
jgi:hypothetical protein